MHEFWDQFNKSTIMSGVLALIVMTAVIYLAVTGQPIPDVLAASASVIVGFFFGARSGQQAERVQQLNRKAYAEENDGRD